ncbi:hypothetical protein GDO78_021990 [Eleutherodactylus coqui]|uniref:Uncharacterized protein n=1 Tax=Eleutherodactylus coqui TaxID=57060 RepID=A0A8J6BMY9_ELECQ|nr:hypothetical protein GDO78_021990 [Eleutherodactylus coqui]
MPPGSSAGGHSVSLVTPPPPNRPLIWLPCRSWKVSFHLLSWVPANSCPPCSCCHYSSLPGHRCCLVFPSRCPLLQIHSVPLRALVL